MCNYNIFAADCEFFRQIHNSRSFVFVFELKFENILHSL